MVEYAKNYQEKERRLKSSRENVQRYNALDSLSKGFTEKYVEAFATFLKATPFQFTLLVSLPQFIGGFIQLFTNEILAFFKTRRRMHTLVVVFQSIAWIPIVWMALKHNEHTMWLYIIVITCYFIFSLLENPLWNSWTMEIVAPEIRGKFISIRARITDVVTLVSFVSGGFLLNNAVKNGTNVDWTFAALFIVAIISNLTGIIYSRKVYEPQLVITKPKRSIRDFFKLIRETHHGSIILYLSLMNFSMYIAEPFFTVYLLKSMKFSYVEFVILAAIPLIVRMLFSERIGNIIDKFGPKKVLIITSMLMVFNPILWLFGTTFWTFMLIRIFTGFSFGVFEMSSVAFFMNETTSSNRMDLLSYFNFVNGTFIVLGALSANLFLRLGPFDDIFLNAFMWSGIMRFAVFIFMFPWKIHEKEHYHRSSYLGLGWSMVFEEKPGELMGKVAKTKDIIALKMKENGMVTKLKSGALISIGKKKGFSGVDPNSRIVKKKPMVEKTKRYEYIKYVCETCHQHFRRHINSKVELKCSICGSKEVHFISYEEEHK